MSGKTVVIAWKLIGNLSDYKALEELIDDAITVELSKALERANTYERDWFDAKHEFGKAMKSARDEAALANEECDVMSKQLREATTELTALRERLQPLMEAAEFAKELLDGAWYDCECEECKECGLTANECKCKACSCSECDYCRSQTCLTMLRAALTAPAPVAQAGGEKGE